MGLEDMQILIPMTGNGSRFVNKGYSRLKPFIEVHGRPIIEWVVKMFKGDEHLINFICRESHLNEFDYLESELIRIAPEGRIISIKIHQLITFLSVFLPLKKLSLLTKSSITSCCLTLTPNLAANAMNEANAMTLSPPS